MSPSFERFIAPARPGAALWRLALGFGLIAAVYTGTIFAATFAYGLVAGLPATAPLVPGRTPGGLLLMLASFAPLILGVVLAVRIVHRRDGRSLLGEAWLADFLRAALLLGLFYGGLLWLAHLSGQTTRPNLSPGLWLALLPLSLGAVLIQTLAEELLFRGYLLQQLAARFAARWVWRFLPALLFGAVHSQPGLFGDAWLFPVVAATLFGLIAADLTGRHGNIGMAWGLHFATNFFALTVVATGPAMTGLALRLSPHQVTDLPGMPLLMLADLAPLILAWAILRRPTAR